MSDSFDGLDFPSNNSGAIHRGVPPQTGAVTEMLAKGCCNTLVRPKSAMRAVRLLSIKILLFASSAQIEPPKESNLRFSGPRAQMASRGDISIHERRLSAVEVGLS